MDESEQERKEINKSVTDRVREGMSLMTGRDQDERGGKRAV